MWIGTASDYTALQKESLINQAKVKDWTEFLTSQPVVQQTQAAYETERKGITAQANYDISKAYANYKKSQISALQNAKLGSGFREEIASELLPDYTSTRQSIEAQKASDLYTSYAEESEALSEIESAYEQQLTTRSEYLHNIEKLAYDYAGITDLSKLGQSIESGGKGFYATDAKTGETIITDTGREFYNKLFNTPGFAEYVYNSDPELYDFYTQNIGDVREHIGGIDRESGKYEANKYLSTSAAHENKVAESRHVLGDNFEQVVYEPKVVGEGLDKKIEFKDASGNTYTLQANRQSEGRSDKIDDDVKGAKEGDVIKYGEKYFIKVGNRWWRLKDDLPWTESVEQTNWVKFKDNFKTNGIQSPSI